MTKMTNAFTEAVIKNVTMSTALAMEGAKDKGILSNVWIYDCISHIKI